MIVKSSYRRYEFTLIRIREVQLLELLTKHRPSQVSQSRARTVENTVVLGGNNDKTASKRTIKNGIDTIETDADGRSAWIAAL